MSCQPRTLGFTVTARRLFFYSSLATHPSSPGASSLRHPICQPFIYKQAYGPALEYAMTSTMDLHTKIETTSRAFVTSTEISPASPFHPSMISTFLSFRTSDALHSWGHNYFVAHSPILPKGKVDNDTFMTRLNFVLPLLEVMHCDVQDIIVDTRNLKAVVRVSLFMKPRGSEVTVENDLVWFLKLKEVEGEVKIVESTEFVDVEAANALGEELGKSNPPAN